MVMLPESTGGSVAVGGLGVAGTAPEAGVRSGSRGNGDLFRSRRPRGQGRAVCARSPRARAPATAGPTSSRRSTGALFAASLK